MRYLPRVVYAVKTVAESLSTARVAHLGRGAVVLITGATGGIGFEIAVQAAEAGAVVGVHGARAESVASTMQRLEARVPGAGLIAAPGDFTQPGAVEVIISKFVEKAGRLDALVHCATAGASETTGLLQNTNPNNYGAFLANMLGIFEALCFHALPHLSLRGGAIVAFASDAGRFAAAHQTLLGGAFGGIMAFVRNLAVEVARQGVRVNCISPSFVVDTPVFDTWSKVTGRANSAMSRAGLGLPGPKDIAPMVIFLCGPGSAKITGQIISINGGLHA